MAARFYAAHITDIGQLDPYERLPHLLPCEHITINTHRSMIGYPFNAALLNVKFANMNPVVKFGSSDTPTKSSIDIFPKHVHDRISRDG